MSMSVAAEPGRPEDGSRAPEVFLVDVLKPGLDRDAEFTAFMAAAAPSLARTAWYLCGDAHLAEELVQQALIRTYLSWSTARTRDPLACARRTLANLRIDV
jgi:DNA-directed RNA polymerase specialized sigma24 family protein